VEVRVAARQVQKSASAEFFRNSEAARGGSEFDSPSFQSLQTARQLATSKRKIHIDVMVHHVASCFACIRCASCNMAPKGQESQSADKPASGKNRGPQFLAEHIDLLIEVFEKHPPIGPGSKDGQMKEKGAEDSVWTVCAKSLTKKLPKTNAIIRAERKTISGDLLCAVDAGRVRKKFAEMMCKYKDTSAKIGYRTTQKTGESGKATALK
jgi:hypothetical protein